MPNCKNCGAPLTKGNIKVVRLRGKKRPYRVCRRCPLKVEPEIVEGKLVAVALVGGTAGDVLQRPQDSTRGPLAVEGAYQYSKGFPSVGYRFFVQPASLEKLKRALEKGDAWLFGFASNWSAGITIEVVPVLEEVVEMNPEAVSHFVEIVFKGGE